MEQCLPYDIFFEIFRHISQIDIIRCKFVCKTLKTYADRFCEYIIKSLEPKYDEKEICRLGKYIEILHYINISSNFSFNRGLRGACYGGHMEIVQLMIEKGANDFGWGLYCACKGGHIEIIQLMIKKGADCFNWGLRGACYGGHMEIVKLMIEKGANDFDWGLRGACFGGHMEIVKFLETIKVNK